MRFYFDIDDSEFEDDWGFDFQSRVQKECVNTISKRIVQSVPLPSLSLDEARKIIQDHRDEIIEAIVDRVASVILKNKQIKSMIPSAAELAQADREVQKYFEQMVDKAIARKFK